LCFDGLVHVILSERLPCFGQAGAGQALLCYFVDCILATFAITRCRIFCLPVCLSKTLKIKIYRTIILPVVLYGCGTWSLTLREECRLWVFENRVLRRVFGPKMDKVTATEKIM
jgi:hypothetical protein